MAKIIDDETMENVCLLAKLSLEEEEREAALMPGTDVWWPRQCLRNQRFLHPNVISARELREVRPVSVSVLIRRSVW